MYSLLVAGLALLFHGSDCLSVSAPRAVNSTDGLAESSVRSEVSRQGRPERSTWEFVSGWARPGAEPGERVPNRTEPQLVMMQAYAPRRRAGIQFITPTYKKKLRGAALVQDSWTQFLGAGDSAVNVVDPDCEEDDHLKSVVVLPPELLNGSSGYYRAQLKHIFGAVYIARELRRRNASTWPLWWVLKDDDTYVSVHNLKADLAARDPSKPLLLGSADGTHVFGGSGMALSWQVVERIVLNNKGDQWLNGMVDNVKHGRVHLDVYMPSDIKENLVHDLEIVNDFNFQHSLDGCGWKLDIRTKSGSQCHVVPEVCRCARSGAPAMWHLTFHHVLQGRLALLEAYERNLTDGGQK